MSVLDREKFMERISAHFGDAPGEAEMSVMEDIIDTYNDMEKRADEDEWKRKYDQLDADWRRRYKERFFTTMPDSAIDNDAYLRNMSNEDVSVESENDNVDYSYDGLFS